MSVSEVLNKDENMRIAVSRLSDTASLFALEPENTASVISEGEGSELLFYGQYTGVQYFYCNNIQPVLY